MKVRSMLKTIINKVKAFFHDEWGGNLVEYALLIGFALFIFMILVGIVTSMLDWTLSQSNDFSTLIGNTGK